MQLYCWHILLNKKKIFSTLLTQGKALYCCHNLLMESDKFMILVMQKFQAQFIESKGQL